MSKQPDQPTDLPTDLPTNRLIHETSPYLLQHAHNPVDWYAWGDEAFAQARAENKPIFLSVGYSACHWCHVMEHESFEDAETAAMMNDLFINIKVDREERPDVDAIYMDAVQALTGQGGWPMSVWLTPTGQPFYGGTYFPNEPRHGMPSFKQVLLTMAEVYRTEPAKVAEQARKVTAALQRMSTLQGPGAALAPQLLDDAVARLHQLFDDENGGFGGAPKFPQPMTLDFLLTQHMRTGDLDTLWMVELTLGKMAYGGLYDQLGGGFHRYSVDAIWLVPHFEKMLYDNAQLLRTYLHAWQLTRRDLYRQVVEQTVDYVLREMTAPEGGFYSTQDADSEGHEGKFFVWTPAEVEEALGERQAAAVVMGYYGVSGRGNFEGKNILHVTRTADELVRRFGLEKAQIEEILATARPRLFAAREQRVPPGCDDKVLVEWNGLMIHALAEIGATLGREDALAAARQAAEFILTRMSTPAGRLHRSYKDGRARFDAYLEDYAALAVALVVLYEATFEERWLAEADHLAGIMLAEFLDVEAGGFFQTGVHHEQLVVRRKDFYDNAIPSGNSLAAEALLRLAVLLGKDQYRGEAERVLSTMQENMRRAPNGFGRLLAAVDRYLAPSQEIVVVGEPGAPATEALLAVVRGRYLPHTAVALGWPGGESRLPLLEGRGLVQGQPAAYVCENYACQLPVTTPEALERLLEGSQSAIVAKP